MNLRKIEYSVNINGVTPSKEQFAGTQGDHRVTKLEFTMTDELYAAVTAAVASVTDGKALYRFDVYNGEGSIWSGDPAELENAVVGIELEERHTRFGGKISVYLVITALSTDNETEIELYSFPARLRLNDKPCGITQDGENYESLTGLVEKAKESEEEALHSWRQARIAASSAEKCALNASTSATEAEKTLANIKTAISDSTDQTYKAESENAQSGVAVAEALKNTVPMIQTAEEGVYAQRGGGLKEAFLINIDNPANIDDTNSGYGKGYIATRNDNGSLTSFTPKTDYEVANKKYVDNISSAKQDVLVSGTNIKTINGESILGSGVITIKGGSEEGVAVDQTYNAESANAQSGTAVAEALSGFFVEKDGVLIISKPVQITEGLDMDDCSIVHVNHPEEDRDAVNKGYVDGEISTIKDLVNTKADLECTTLSGELYATVGTTDGIYNESLSKIEFIDVGDGTFLIMLTFESAMVSSNNTYATEDDVTSAGFEVGKKYKFVIENGAVTSIALITTLENKANISYVNEKLGDIETALDSIIAIQEELIGGDSE